MSMDTRDPRQERLEQQKLENKPQKQQAQKEARRRKLLASQRQTSAAMQGGLPRAQFSRRRFRGVLGLLVLIGILILGKLLYIQVIDADHLKRKARSSRNQALTLFNRGRILDRNGSVLAQDTVLYDLFAHPDYFHGISREDVASALAPALGLHEDLVLKKLKAPYTTIGVIKNLRRDQVEKILALRVQKTATDPKTHKLILNEQGQPLTRPVPLPGLDFSRKNVRNYPQGNLAAHVLGYVNDEAEVSSGIEASAADILKKRPIDLNQTVLDGRGNLVDLERLEPSKLVSLPKAEDVRLTIDARLQYVAERELAAGIARSHAKRGTVIMMNPRNGEILAFAVAPSYQPNLFYKAPPDELKNWVLTDVYPPGSTFKILTVASGLETGVINLNSRIMDTGRMTVGGWTIQNYDYGKHGAPGMIDLVYLLIHSSNIASAKISMMMPIAQHYDILKRVGIGSRTGIDLPGESRGLLIDQEQWKDQSTHASIGYGYGMAATPIQMAAGVAAIANGGIWNTPHIMAESPVAHRRIFSPKTSEEMRILLTRSIAEAKTSTVRLDSVEVAGKTGTSRKPNANGRGYSPDIFTSFVGYFPARSPKILMMVVLDSPHIAEAWGSTVAGPIFKNIAEETVSYLGLSPARIKNERIKAGSLRADEKNTVRRTVPGLSVMPTLSPAEPTTAEKHPH